MRMIARSDYRRNETAKWANILILWNILKSKADLFYKWKIKIKYEQKLGIELIWFWKIFQRNAISKESKLQIELAAIKHMWPRIFDMGMELWKQSWKWKWETNTEIMKRHLKKRERTCKRWVRTFCKG